MTSLMVARMQRTKGKMRDLPSTPRSNLRRERTRGKGIGVPTVPSGTEPTGERRRTCDALLRGLNQQRELPNQAARPPNAWVRSLGTRSGGWLLVGRCRFL